MKVKFDDLEFALEFASMDSYCEHLAYLCLKTGAIYYDSDFSEDELPDDLDNHEKYIALPDKRELGLGRSLAIKFVEIYLPGDIDTVYSIFRSRGAYSRYKSLLNDRNSLDHWYKFEQAEQKEQLLNWCKLNHIELDI